MKGQLPPEKKTLSNILRNRWTFGNHVPQSWWFASIPWPCPILGGLFWRNGFTRQCVRFFVLDCSWLASNWSSTRIIYVWFWMLFAANASGLKIHGERKNGHQSGVGILNGQDTHTIQGALFPKQKLRSCYCQSGPQDGTTDAAGSQRKKEWNVWNVTISSKRHLRTLGTTKINKSVEFKTSSDVFAGGILACTWELQSWTEELIYFQRPNKRSEFWPLPNWGIKRLHLEEC